MNALLLQSRKTANDRWCKTTSDANTVLDTEGAKLSIEPLGGQLVTTDAHGESAQDSSGNPTFWC
jgi:hypothetical protein